jgi:hypothetical protein
MGEAFVALLLQTFFDYASQDPGSRRIRAGFTLGIIKRHK